MIELIVEKLIKIIVKYEFSLFLTQNNETELIKKEDAEGLKKRR